MADPIVFPRENDSNEARTVIATKEPVALRTYTPSQAVLRKSFVVENGRPGAKRA